MKSRKHPKSLYFPPVLFLFFNFFPSNINHHFLFCYLKDFWWINAWIYQGLAILLDFISLFWWIVTWMSAEITLAVFRGTSSQYSLLLVSLAWIGGYKDHDKFSILKHSPYQNFWRVLLDLLFTGRHSLIYSKYPYLTWIYFVEASSQI